MGLISGFQKRRLEQRLEKSPQDVDAYARLASLHRKDGDSVAAIRVFATALRRLPAEAGQRLLSELELESRTDRLDLVPVVQQLRNELQNSSPAPPIELFARLEGILLHRAWLDPQAAGLHRDAVVRHSRAVLDSATPWARLLLARAYLFEGASDADRAAAAEALEGLVPTGKDPLFDGELWLCRGDLHAGHGKSTEAEEAYHQAGRTFQDPVGLAESRLRLGRLARDANRTEQAVDHFNAALNYLGSRSEVVWVHAELARLYARQHRLDEARTEIRRAMTSPHLGPAEKVDLSLLEAELLALERQDTEAIAVARHALELASTSAASGAGAGRLRIRALTTLADLLSGTEESHLEAVDHYRTLLEIGDGEDEPGTRFRLGRALLKVGRPEEAVDVLQTLRVGQTVPGATAVEVGLLLVDANVGAGEHITALDRLSEIKALGADVEEAVEARARRFRRELAAGELPGVVSEKLRAQIDSKLSELVGEAALLERMRIRLSLSRESLVGRLENLLAGRNEVNDTLFDDLEELLITADVGPQTSVAIIDKLRKAAAQGRLKSAVDTRAEIRDLMLDILQKSTGRLELRPTPPTVILMIGVNGAGKTTTIAKLAHRFREEGKSVLLVAADTFRAGAIEQLQVWADRVGVPLVRQQEGSDPSAVAYDGAQAAKARNAEVVIIDTAGRLQTKVNLMEELKKIVRVLSRQLEGAPHEVLLVLDGTSGQNAMSQARLFSEAANVTGIVLTKLDGTAKGGTILSIANEMRIPIKLIGIGERMTDLRDFDPSVFVEALFGERTDVEVSKKSTAIPVQR